MKPPNILWFSLEDTSPTFGCHGDPVARTPRLDRIAAEGCVYERAFSTAPVCAPSRNSIITARYSTANGGHHMRTTHGSGGLEGVPFPYESVPPPHVKCFTEYLRAAGYFCTNNLKTDYQFSPPTSAWDECGAEAHWRHRAPGQPFFAVFNPTNTHESGQWAENGDPLTDPDRLSLPPFLPDTPEMRQSLARQYDQIAASDATLGQLLAQLEEDGLREDTIVMIWSDHGMGLPRFKRWPYDTGLRVPLIVRAPGLVEAGARSDELISLVDLGPTVMALAGLPRLRHFHGRNFLGPDRDLPRDCVFATRDRYDESYDKVRSVRDARFRYICNSYPNLEREIYVPYRNRHPAMQEIWARAAAGALTSEQAWFAPGPRPAEELYDLDTDPWELRNLAGDPACQSELQRLRSKLADWQDRHDPWFDIAEAQMVRMWQPDGVQPRTSAPYAVALGPNQPGTSLLSPEATLARPVLIQLGCPTEGASLEYQIGQADRLSRWRLHAGPFALPAGCTAIRARACRYGFQPSVEADWRITLQG